MPAGDLTVTARQFEAGILLEVAGELDLSTLPVLDAELDLALGSSRVVIDLSGCTFLDSSALRTIVVASRAAEEGGGSLALVAPSPATRRVLDIASLDRVISVYDTVGQAQDAGSPS